MLGAYRRSQRTHGRIASLGAAANAVRASQKALHHDRRTWNDGAATVTATGRHGIDSKRGADVGDDDCAPPCQRVRADGGDPAIRAEPPRVAVTVGDAAGASRGSNVFRRNTKPAAHGRVEHARQRFVHDAHDEHAIHVARSFTHQRTKCEAGVFVRRRLHAPLPGTAQRGPLDARIADVD